MGPQRVQRRRQHRAQRGSEHEPGYHTPRRDGRRRLYDYADGDLGLGPLGKRSEDLQGERGRGGNPHAHAHPEADGNAKADRDAHAGPEPDAHADTGR